MLLALEGRLYRRLCVIPDLQVASCLARVPDLACAFAAVATLLRIMHTRQLGHSCFASGHGAGHLFSTRRSHARMTALHMTRPCSASHTRDPRLGVCFQVKVCCALPVCTYDFIESADKGDFAVSTGCLKVVCPGGTMEGCMACEGWIVNYNVVYPWLLYPCNTTTLRHEALALSA